MGTVGTLIIWNIVAIGVISLIAGLVTGTFSSRGEKMLAGGFASLWVGNLLFALSVVGWVIYVVAHFVQKFW